MSGIRLVYRIRQLCFQSILKQDMSFFDDDKKHAVGILSAKLATDADHIKGLTGQLLGSIAQSLSSIIIGFIVSFVNGPLLALIMLALIPIMAAAQSLQLSKLKG